MSEISKRSSAEFRPEARTEGLIVEELDGELLVYDTERDKAHALNGVAALVWQQSDGHRTIERLADAIVTDVEDPTTQRAVVMLALRQLWDRKLLVTAPPSEEGVTRREVMRKAAWAGAVGLSIPVVKSIIAPTAAQAATCKEPGEVCVSSAQCCSGVCSGGFCL